MLDIKLIRENPEFLQKKLAAKKVKVDFSKVQKLDEKRRSVIKDIDELRAKTNEANDEIGRLKKEKKDIKAKISSMKKIASEIDGLQPKLKDIEKQIDDVLIGIPNIPHESVPVGPVKNNKVIRLCDNPKKADFKLKGHMELAESLDIIDFKRASKISGSNFILFKGQGARLERALINYMLDLHTQKHNYLEVFPPFLVNTPSMTGTGQLPKMKEDMYYFDEDDLYLIPTAEVPVTNIHRDEILREEDLPICYTAYTACFRREAGSYGKDTKGLNRVHQFDKVELVKFVKPENSYDELESLVAHAEVVLQQLDLPYRVVLLASEDLSFAAAKCYDLEVHSLGSDKWLEVSSCSNFEDFQARRSNIRFKGKNTKRPSFVHTLNGSGLALARIVLAIIENYQTKQGDILIPEVLRPYMGGLEKITHD